MQINFTRQPSSTQSPVTKKTGSIGFLSGAILLGALSGCVGYVEHPHGGVAYVEPAPVYVDPGYVYYPGYQVYYSGHTHQYVYQDGHSWVSRSAPPHVSAHVLSTSPSVRMDFHDSPSIHHSTVVQQYPKNWAPTKSNHGHNDEHDQGNRKEHD